MPHPWPWCTQCQHKAETKERQFWGSSFTSNPSPLTLHTIPIISVSSLLSFQLHPLSSSHCTYKPSTFLSLYLHTLYLPLAVLTHPLSSSRCTYTPSLFLSLYLRLSTFMYEPALWVTIVLIQGADSLWSYNFRHSQTWTRQPPSMIATSSLCMESRLCSLREVTSLIWA